MFDLVFTVSKPPVNRDSYIVRQTGVLRRFYSGYLFNIYYQVELH